MRLQENIQDKRNRLHSSGKAILRPIRNPAEDEPSLPEEH